MTKVLITGVNGFVGKALGDKLVTQGFNVNGAVRPLASVDFPDTITKFVIKDIDSKTDWQKALEGVGVVIHLAARVHVMKDTAKDALAEFRKVNVEGTLNLARQAAEAGVERFIFISSIKVNGEGTLLGQPYTAEDQPAPVDAYGISKREAEDALRQLASETAMEVVIIRPPLIYGPGVRANFLRLMQLVKMGVPLPFGAVHNRRSMVALDNLVDLLITCTHHPAAAGQVFMVSDDNDVSISELLRMIASAMGKRSILLPVPAGIIAGVAALLGKSAVANRLLGSLQVDIAHTKSTLGWQPIVSMQESVNKTVAHFLRNQ